MSRLTYVIVGGGVAGASAAEALRGEGFDGRIVLVGEERVSPYERPPLSKGLLRGEIGRETVILRAPEFYERNAVELRPGEVVSSLDVRSRRIELADGGTVSYDRVLVATGAAPRRLGVPGEDLPGVHRLRTLDDSLRLAEALQRHPAVLVVGGGFIGSEVAASARQMGCEVTIVGPTLPMEHALGAEIGELYANYHRDHGVTVTIGVTVVGFLGTGALEAARLSDGKVIACGAAVVGVGATPSVAWLGDDVKLTGGGVETDEFCRTSVEHVLAAGDVACSWRPRLNRRVRLEHFDNAESQGAAAGRTMSGTMRAYDPLPFFWSDQYDLSLQYYGHAAAWDRVVIRRGGDGAFAAFYLSANRIEAACAVNLSQEASAIKRLVGQRDVSEQDLADSDVRLTDLASTHEVRSSATERQS